LWTRGIVRIVEGGEGRLLIGYPAYLHQASFCQLYNKLFRLIYIYIYISRGEGPRKVI